MLNNKRLITILLSSIALVSLIAFTLTHGSHNPVTRAANDTSAMAGRLVSGPANMMTRFTDSVGNLVNTFEENQHLKEKNDQVYELQVRVADLEAENAKMRQELDLTEILSQYSIVHGTVVARNPDQWVEYLTINVGAHDGIEEDMAVMSGNGLIGRVIEVNQFSSKVLLLSSEHSQEGKVAASVQTTDGSANGIISGYDQKTKNYLMTHVAPDAEIKEGDMVITSGLGGVTPSTLLIGEVASAKLDDYGLFKLVEVKPAGEMTDIRFVTVIKRQERSDGEVTDFEALEESSLDLEALISGEGEEDADFTEE